MLRAVTIVAVIEVVEVVEETLDNQRVIFFQVNSILLRFLHKQSERFPWCKGFVGCEELRQSPTLKSPVHCFQK